jgi:sulfite dehydrogenase (cytochrome) subunit B
MKTGRTALFTIVLASATAAGFAHAKTIQLPPDNAMAKLKPWPGLRMTEAYCRMCHSTDYIVRQPRESPHAWQAEVAKMIKVYGAPIPKADARVISEYLAFAYGTKTSKNDHQKKSGEP